VNDYVDRYVPDRRRCCRTPGSPPGVPTALPLMMNRPAGRGSAAPARSPPGCRPALEGLAGIPVAAEAGAHAVQPDRVSRHAAAADRQARTSEFCSRRSICRMTRPVARCSRPVRGQGGVAGAADRRLRRLAPRPARPDRQGGQRRQCRPLRRNGSPSRSGRADLRRAGADSRVDGRHAPERLRHRRCRSLQRRQPQRCLSASRRSLSPRSLPPDRESAVGRQHGCPDDPGPARQLSRLCSGWRAATENTLAARAIVRFRRVLAESHYGMVAGALRQGEVAVTPLLGFGSRDNELNRVILQLIQRAQRHLVLFTPYFNLPGAVRRALDERLRQRCRVTIVVGDKTANDFYIPPDEPFTTIGACLTSTKPTCAASARAGRALSIRACSSCISGVTNSTAFTSRAAGRRRLRAADRQQPQSARLAFGSRKRTADPRSARRLLGQQRAELERVSWRIPAASMITARSMRSTATPPVQRLLKRLARTPRRPPGESGALRRNGCRWR
jgi:hypothetical protein